MSKRHVVIARALRRPRPAQLGVAILWLALLFTLAVYTREAHAQSAHWSLFNRTPDAKAREMSTDRPDKTESPYTVPAGHWQVESDLVTVTRNGSAVGRDVASSFAASNIKLGLTHRIDLQVVVEPMVRRVTRDAGGVSRQRERGDITTRLKVNVWGNDGGTTAFGVMPFAVATRRDDGTRATAGGVILPLSVALPWGWGFGTMAEFDVDPVGARGHEWTAVWSGTVGRDLTSRLGFYVEYFAAAPFSGGASVTSADAGLTFAVTPTVQLDGGFNRGLSRAADRINPFLGLSFRF